MSDINEWYGWRPDKPDHRDFKLKAGLASLPLSVDLREGFPPCYDQSNLGSCTANAIAGVLEYDQKKQGALETVTPSRLFIYYNERAMEGTVDVDGGAEIRDGVKSINDLGAPPEPEWPYRVNRYSAKPDPEIYASAMKHKAVSYHRVDNTNPYELKACLAAGFPIVFGFMVYESFESEGMAKSGILFMPQTTEKPVGGHAVVLSGYDEERKKFLVRNSWGIDWGQGGYFWMPYEYLTTTDLADDFWQITQIT